MPALSPATLQVLLALSAGDATATEVIERILVEAGPISAIPEQTVYTTLRRLVRDGLIAAVSAKNRATYRITPLGCRFLRAELPWLQTAARLLQARL